MPLFFAILSTSLSAMLVTWFATSWLAPGGANPLASALVGVAVALAWARALERLSNQYLAGQFTRVRKRLSLVGASMGIGETILVKLWIDVETRDSHQLAQGLEAAGTLGLETFARAWTAGQQARMDGQPERAYQAFSQGAQQVRGLDRAELWCEAALTLLQMSLMAPPDAREQAIRQAIEAHNRAGTDLHENASGVGGRARLRYLDALYAGVRALIHLAQHRPAEALNRLAEVIPDARGVLSLRARRLAQALEIERLWAIRETEGREAFLAGVSELSGKVHLPLLRMRLAEIASADHALTGRVRSESASGQSHAATQEARDGVPSDPPQDAVRSIDVALPSVESLFSSQPKRDVAPTEQVAPPAQSPVRAPVPAPTAEILPADSAPMSGAGGQLSPMDETGEEA